MHFKVFWIHLILTLLIHLVDIGSFLTDVFLQLQHELEEVTPFFLQLANLRALLLNLHLLSIHYFTGALQSLIHFLPLAVQKAKMGHFLEGYSLGIFNFPAGGQVILMLPIFLAEIIKDLVGIPLGGRLALFHEESGIVRVLPLEVLVREQSQLQVQLEVFVDNFIKDAVRPL